MGRITVRVDRRAEIIASLRAELTSLAESVAGLRVEFDDPAQVEAARDQGKFRDFVVVAHLDADETDVLEWAAEELVEEFGWLVDVGLAEED